MTLARRLTAEALGTAFLLAAVVGSGIMGDRLAGGNVAIALLANTIATGAALVTLILALGPVSGAHFNPVVTLVGAWKGSLPWREVAGYIASQLLGAIAGVLAAHFMFEEQLIQVSAHLRSGLSQFFSESVATLGLLLVIALVSRRNAAAIPYAVGAYITSAYWFTASTSFANPAVTIARALTNTFAGIRPADVPAFVIAQFTGAAAATLLTNWIAPISIDTADRKRAEAMHG